MTPMPEWFSELPLVPILFASGLVTVFALVAAFDAAVAYDRARSRFPEAAFLEAQCETLSARVEDKKQRLSELEQELSQRQKALAEVDKNKAEAEFWQERLAALDREWSERQDRRQEIEDIRRQAQESYEEAAQEREKLDAVRNELGQAQGQAQGEYQRLEMLRADSVRLEQEATAAANRLSALNTEVQERREESYALRRTVREAEERREALVRKSEILERQAAENEARHKQLEEEISGLEERREELAALTVGLEEARQEADAARVAAREADERREGLAREVANLERRAVEIEAHLARLEPEVAELERRRKEVAAVTTEVEEIRAEFAALRQVVEDAKRKRDSLAAEIIEFEAEHRRLKQEVADLATRHKELREAIADLDEMRNEKWHLRNEIDAARQERVELQERLSNAQEAVLRAEARTVALETQKAQLEKEISGLVAPRTGAPKPSPRGDVLAELLSPPACLTEEGYTERAAARDEREVLADVQRRLEAFELTFPRRVVHAFHTALKVGETSPLTVLAGVSGTGKSQLPRRYAEAMGIHFLQVPVQPRWDSPQDLMGFYNYIEQRYRATDLARALVHLDPLNFPEEARKWEGRMLLVLLDEMNLSRVEYYFSEFLSRLEVRPRIDGTDAGRRTDAEIPIDIPGLDDGVARKVYPGHNLLFVGTMNEDESTQSLSDKVLDRANLIRFPRPSTFANAPKQNRRDGTDGRQDRFLHFESWRSWLRSTAQMRAPDRERLDRRIDRLNEIIDQVGRGFGHRLHQSMAAYVANYPDGEGAADAALADQVEMRILPKLRGIDVETSGRCLDELRGFVDEELGDAVLAEAVGVARDKARESGGLFVWTGLTRQ